MPTIHSIQVLRALAAFMVAIHHAQWDASLLAERFGLGFVRNDMLPWMAGVDIFFVVSGFIMVHASADLFGRPGAWRAFLSRRIARIVPLYWAATTLFLLVVFTAPAALNSGRPDLGQILASYLFWPTVSTQGLVQPVYSLGWTLNYEMLFYALFSLGLLLPGRWTLPAVTVALVLLVGAADLAGALPLPLGFWGQPIVLEFAAGMGIAVLRRRGLRLGTAMRIAIALAGLAVLAVAARFDMSASAWAGPLWHGSAAVLLVLAAGCGARRERPASAPVRALAAVGDASYALYLVHPFVIRALRQAMSMAGLAMPLLFVALALAGALVAALLVHRFFEKPATRAMRRLLAPRVASTSPKA